MASDTTDTGDMDGIELADAVESIRNQLVEAAGRATGRPVAFEVGDIQMEFTLELRKEVKGGGKVKAWVVEAGTDASRATSRTHKVAFTLKPRDAATGGPWQIGHGDQGSTAHFGQRGQGSATHTGHGNQGSATHTGHGAAQP